MNDLQEKKIQRGNGLVDFLAKNEITVTITLREYRELVEKSARSQQTISEAATEKWSVVRRCELFEKENEDLKAELCTMQKELDSLRTVDTNEVCEDFKVNYSEE